MEHETREQGGDHHGRGLGDRLGLPRRFLEEGAKVMVADIGEEQGQATADALDDLGEIAFVRTDIADETSVAECVAATVDRFGSVDILLNNAAIYGDYVGSDHSLEYLRTVFDVNLHGQWLIAHGVAPHMVQQRWGRIVNIASIAAYLHQLAAAGPSDPEHFELSSYSYAQSKWGVLGLTRQMAGQLGQFNVTVNCIAPGLVHDGGNGEAGAQRLPPDVRVDVVHAPQHRRRAHGRHRGLLRVRRRRSRERAGDLRRRRERHARVRTGGPIGHLVLCPR